MTKAYSFLLLCMAACAVHADVDFLMWHQGRINRISSADESMTPISPVTGTAGATLWGDYEDELVFFVGSGYIGKAPMDGSATSVVVPHAVDSFAIDAEQNKVYYISEDPYDTRWPPRRQLFRCEYDGTGKVVLVDNLDTYRTDCLQIDSSEGKIYWKAFYTVYDGFPPSIHTPFYRCNTDGSDFEMYHEPDFGPSGIPEVGDVYISHDSLNSKMYWTSGNEIHVVDLENPSQTEQIRSSPPLTNYWTYMEFREGKLYGLAKLSDQIPIKHQFQAVDPLTKEMSVVATIPFDSTFVQMRFGAFTFPGGDAGGNAAVAGGWSEWSEFGGCDLECGGGTQSQSRQCDDPEPANGGAECTLLDGTTGLSETRSRGCNTDNCIASGMVDDNTSKLCDDLYGAGATRGLKKDIRVANCETVCTAAGLECKMAVKIYPNPVRRVKLQQKLNHVYTKGECKTRHGNGCCCISN